jgi:hypothetical protein
MRKKKPGRKSVAWKATSLPDGLLPELSARETGWEDGGRRLVEVYNVCLERAATAGEFKYRRKRATLDNVEVFYGLELWCRARQLDPGAWIWSVFASLGWKRPVGLRELLSDGRRKTYDQLYDTSWAQLNAMLTTVDQDTNDRFQPFRDLAPGAEEAKRQYAARGDADLCMINIDITLGFHPESTTCSRCPLRTQCQQRTSQTRTSWERRKGPFPSA